MDAQNLSVIEKWFEGKVKQGFFLIFAIDWWILKVHTEGAMKLWKIIKYAKNIAKKWSKTFSSCRTRGTHNPELGLPYSSTNRLLV